jgi:hypothetical protein
MHSQQNMKSWICIQEIVWITSVIVVLFLFQDTNKMQRLQTICSADSSRFLVINFIYMLIIILFLAIDMQYVCLLLTVRTS